MSLGRIQKAVTALVTGVIGWGFVVVASAPANITASEWLGLAVVVATALGVYAVPNAPAPAPSVAWSTAAQDWARTAYGVSVSTPTTSASPNTRTMADGPVESTR